MSQRTVLIVSPHFPPVNAPDHQRVRMSLPFYQEFGWQAIVLAANADCVTAARDELQAETIPSTVRVIRHGALPAEWTRRVGLGNLGWRALPALALAGGCILKSERVDVVFFSTTQFPAMLLGPWWERRFGVPYVIDYQDPWLTDYYVRPGAPEPPGGRRKYAVARFLARLGEPPVIRNASGVMTVSGEYARRLVRRYGRGLASRIRVLPFGAPVRDAELARKWKIEQTVFDPHDGFRHWVSVGAIGPMMHRALELLFAGMRAERETSPQSFENLRLHFVGTSYAEGRAARESGAPLARQFGLDGIVEERTARIPYFEAMRVRAEADVVLLPGSDEPGYSPSKVLSCFLARRPILAMTLAGSRIEKLLSDCRFARHVAFEGSRPSAEELGAMRLAVRTMLERQTPVDDADVEAIIRERTDRDGVRRQVRMFERCMAERRWK